MLGQDHFSRFLRDLVPGQRAGEIFADAVGGKDEPIAAGQWQDGSLERRQLYADNPGTQQQRFFLRRRRQAWTKQDALDVPHTYPRHQLLDHVEGSDAHRDPARSSQPFVALPNQ